MTTETKSLLRTRLEMYGTEMELLGMNRTIRGLERDDEYDKLLTACLKDISTYISE